METHGLARAVACGQVQTTLHVCGGALTLVLVLLPVLVLMLLLHKLPGVCGGRHSQRHEVASAADGVGPGAARGALHPRSSPLDVARVRGVAQLSLELQQSRLCGGSEGHTQHTPCGTFARSCSIGVRPPCVVISPPLMHPSSQRAPARNGPCCAKGHLISNVSCKGQLLASGFWAPTAAPERARGWPGDEGSTERPSAHAMRAVSKHPTFVPPIWNLRCRLRPPAVPVGFLRAAGLPLAYRWPTTGPNGLSKVHWPTTGRPPLPSGDTRQAATTAAVLARRQPPAAPSAHRKAGSLASHCKSPASATARHLPIPAPAGAGGGEHGGRGRGRGRGRRAPVAALYVCARAGERRAQSTRAAAKARGSAIGSLVGPLSPSPGPGERWMGRGLTGGRPTQRGHQRLLCAGAISFTAQHGVPSCSAAWRRWPVVPSLKQSRCGRFQCPLSGSSY